MKTFTLPCFGIVVNVEGKSGTIKSKLRENLRDVSPSDQQYYELNTAIDALEAMILACACAGIDIETPAFLEAIETVVDKFADVYC